jgi:hypothetical protein
MKLICVTTIIRNKRAPGKRGHFYTLDYDTKEVLSKQGTPGLRGMCFHEGKLWVGDFKKFLRTVNPTTGLVEQELNLQELAGVHLIYSRDGYLWLTNTASNSILKMQNSKVVDIIELAPSNEHLHFNSMGWAPNGDQYHLYSHLGQIYNYTKREVAFDGIERGHDLHFLDDHRLLVNESRYSRGLLVDLSDKTRTELHAVPQHREDTPHIRWGFTRGIAASKDLIFMGSSPAKLHIFDGALKMVDTWEISTTPTETIFDICLDPRDWDF